MKRKTIIFTLITVLTMLLAASCATEGQEPAEITQDLTPTVTEMPMAARVNGTGILMADFEEELRRYQSAVGEFQMDVSVEEARQQVLDYLIEQALFVQAAEQNGNTVGEAELAQKIAELTEARGGQANLDTYLAENFYTPQSFRRAIARELAMIWMRNYLIDQVPATAEQIHARQILVDTENEAIAVQRRLEVGTPFVDLAYEYDLLTGGELGWFSRGYLFQPAVEDAAFALQPGQYSGIIQTDYGFHIVEVIERDPQRELVGDALLAAQHEAIASWLAGQLDQAVVEIYIN